MNEGGEGKESVPDREGAAARPARQAGPEATRTARAGASILARLEMKSSETRSFPLGEVAWYSTRSPDKQTANEDALATIDIDADRLVLAVADGLGGRPGGAEAAESALAAVADAIALRDSDDEALQPSILKGFERANEAVKSLGMGAAATLVIVEIDRTTARSYHVGDSVALVVGQRGRQKFETVPHSPVGYAVESGMLDARDAMHHEERHIVSNVVGSPDMRIDVGPPIELAEYDTLLLGSDGLFDNLLMDEIIETIRKGPLQEVAAELIAAASSRMTQPRENKPSKPDDLTFILFRRQV